MKNVTFNQIVCYCDRFVASQEGELYFLSLYGSSQAVSSILAAIVEYMPIEIQQKGKPLAKLQPEPELDSLANYLTVKRTFIHGRHTHIKTQPLSWGRAHGLFWDERCVLKQSKDDFIVIGNTEQQTHELLFQTIAARPVPLLREWSAALTDALADEGCIQPLKSYGCHAFFVQYDEQLILQTLSNYIQAGEIQLPTAA